MALDSWDLPQQYTVVDSRLKHSDRLQGSSLVDRYWRMFLLLGRTVHVVPLALRVGVRYSCD